MAKTGKSLEKWDGKSLESLSKTALIQLVKKMASLHDELMERERCKAAFNQAVMRNEGPNNN